MTKTKTLTPTEYDNLPWMHVYPQSHAHAPAEIRGTREAMIALRDTIDRALNHSNGEAEFQAFTKDGEGYGVLLRRVPRDALHRSRLPYRW